MKTQHLLVALLAGLLLTTAFPLAAEVVPTSSLSLTISSLPEAQISYDQAFTIPFLQGEGALTRGNNIKFTLSEALSPVSVSLTAGAVWTPIAFLQLKAGAEIGLVWAPEKTILKSLAGDYTAIMPYMYTHMYDSLNEENYDDRYPSQSGYTGSKPNYLEYSHIGRGLGADLDPNSDRVSVRAAFKPLGNFDLSLLGYFSRHGNASQNRIDEGLMDGTYHDGSIHDDGNNDGEWTDANGETHGTADNYDNNYSELRFLTQSVLETKLAVGFGLTWHVPLPPSFGELSLNAEYVAEYGWNRDLVRDNNSLRHYWSLGGAYRW